MADGLGGHECGEVASKIAVTVIGTKFTDVSYDFNMEETILAANEAIKAEQKKKDKPMKTTVAGIAEYDGKVLVAHVGDSRVYLFKEGKIVHQTEDHSVSQLAVLRGKITPDEIRHHKDRSKLCMVLGEDDPIEPEIVEIEANSFDAALVCSDGFWENVLECEMEQTLVKADTPEVWMEAMREILKSRIDTDNDNNSAIAVFYNVR